MMRRVEAVPRRLPFWLKRRTFGSGSAVENGTRLFAEWILGCTEVNLLGRWFHRLTSNVIVEQSGHPHRVVSVFARHSRAGQRVAALFVPTRRPGRLI